MASFFRNTFDNLLNNISSTINSTSQARFVPPHTANRQANARAAGRGTGRPPDNSASAQEQQNNCRSARNSSYNITSDLPYPPPHHHQFRPQPTTVEQQINMNSGYPCNNASNATNPNINPAPRINDKIDIQDVRDPNDINNLSAKQLKIILTRNCVDYKGVFEKEVLREKVMQLWIDHNERRERRRARRNQSATNTNRSQDSADEIDDNQLCKICMEREIDCVLLECGHYFTCVTCGRKLADCPICRQNVTRCVRTFRC